jgi:LmbE family N-acetylglucosaminyl deacetylase
VVAEPLINPARVLAIAAHPDDLDFAFSGTAAGWVKDGVEITYLVATHGEEGGFDDTPREQMPVIREREQRDAAAAVGVHDVRFLTGFRDGWLEPNRELVGAIVRAIRQVRPERVVVSSPERNWERIGASHPDHLAVGEATVRAIYPAARNAFAFPELLADEGLEPWTAPSLWLVADPRPDTYVDVTDQFGQKMAALKAHVSQTAHRGDDLEKMLRAWGTTTAGAAGFEPGRLAEAFRAVDTA